MEIDCDTHLLDIQLLVAAVLGALKSDRPDKAKIAVAIQILEKLDEAITHVVFDKYDLMAAINQSEDKATGFYE